VERDILVQAADIDKIVVVDNRRIVPNYEIKDCQWKLRTANVWTSAVLCTLFNYRLMSCFLLKNPLSTWFHVLHHRGNYARFVFASFYWFWGVTPKLFSLKFASPLIPNSSDATGYKSLTWTCKAECGQFNLAHVDTETKKYEKKKRKQTNASAHFVQSKPKIREGSPNVTRKSTEIRMSLWNR